MHFHQDLVLAEWSDSSKCNQPITAFFYLCCCPWKLESWYKSFFVSCSYMSAFTSSNWMAAFRALLSIQCLSAERLGIGGRVCPFLVMSTNTHMLARILVLFLWWQENVIASGSTRANDIYKTSQYMPLGLWSAIEFIENGLYLSLCTNKSPFKYWLFILAF